MRKLMGSSLLALACLSCGGGSGSNGSAPVNPGHGIPSNDDTANPGTPTSKAVHTTGLVGGQGNTDHFTYDTTNYWTQTRTIHGTSFEVAIHKSVITAGGGPAAQAFSDFVYLSWHIAWHVFGGFQFDRYAVKVRDTVDADVFALSRVGVSIPYSTYSHPSLWEFAAHEMFHSWMGGAIEQKADGSGNIFQIETWMFEGCTTYYGLRNAGFAYASTQYTNGMSSRWSSYTANLGTAFDLSIQDLANGIGNDLSDHANDSTWSAQLYNRGAFLCWMIDRDLTENGGSLDDLMKELYENFALLSIQLEQADIPMALQSISGSDFMSYFNTYLDTNAQFPLDGSFNLLER